MGCSEGDSECYDDEKPAHTVHITKGFWIGQTEVTQEAWQRLMGDNPSHFKGPRLPVESVTWTQADAFCRKAAMRLPTEAEWEYAARAGSAAGRYGDVDRVAWYSGNSGSKTHEVGGKSPNAWTLYDTLGNVWEWVADWYYERYYSNGDARDPRGPSSGTYRALRGGSWLDVPRDARVSNRGRGRPENRVISIGLRCAGELP
jgi:formylglycine-generating enzyme required for sulfatase activity